MGLQNPQATLVMFDIILPIAGIWINVLVVAGVGLLIGAISGLFGVGGGFLMTPLLIFLGVPPAIAVATGSAQLVASSSFGTASAYTARLIDRALSIYLLIGALIGTLLGIGLFNILNKAGSFDLFVGWSYVVLLGTVGSLMLKESFSALRQHRQGHGEKPQANKIQKWFSQWPGQRIFDKFDISMSPLPLIVISTLIGMIGSILGVGGGFLFVPVLIYFFGLPVRAAVAASQVQILFTMIIATILHAVYNHAIDVVLAAPLIFGGVLGAHIGGKIGQHVKGVHFRIALAVLILGVACRFLFTMILSLFYVYQGITGKTVSLSSLPPWEGWIALVAEHNRFFYGVMTTLISLVAGFGANFILNRRSTKLI